jgi:predicted RNA-binding Zn-ribbon protein involved in translation (DUF1610 family)
MEGFASIAFLLGSPIFFAYGMRKKLYIQKVGGSVFILGYVLLGLLVTVARPNEGAFFSSFMENVLVTFVWGVVAGSVILVFTNRSFIKGLNDSVKKHNEKQAAKQEIYVKNCRHCGYNEEFRTRVSNFKCPNCGKHASVRRCKV